jgi:hypothetical protein
MQQNERISQVNEDFRGLKINTSSSDEKLMQQNERISQVKEDLRGLQINMTSSDE